jgi:hypothetical protein
MRHHAFFFLLLLTAAPLLKGQSLYRDAYLINRQNETVPGLIADQGEIQNSKVCFFRPDKESDVVTYLPGSILAYGFTDGARYETKTVKFGGNPQQIFAECLVKGKASLYYLRNDSLEYYFIEKSGSGFYPLKPGSGQDQRMLKAIFSDCMEVQSDIDRAQLNHRSLVRITCQYNNCDGQADGCTTFGSSSRIELQIAPVIGFSSEWYSVTGEEPFDSFDFDPDHVPVFGLWLDLSSSRLGEHLSFQLGAEAATKSKYYTEYGDLSQIGLTDYYYYVHMQGIAARMFAGASWHITQNGIRPALGGGLLLQKFIQPEFWYDRLMVTGPVELTDEWRNDLASSLFYGAYAQAGVETVLNGKHILFASIRGGFLITNPETIAGLNNGVPYQIRLRSVVIPLSFHVGFFF